jgi:hypothetical protein
VPANLGQRVRLGSSEAGRQAIAARPVLSHVPVVVLIVGHMVRFGELGLQMDNGYGDSAFDLGVFDQALWLLSRFHAPFLTGHGPQPVR